MTSLEEILVRLGLDATRMEEGYRKAGEKTKEWAKEQMKVIGGIGAAWLGIEGVKKAYEQTVEYSEKLIDLSHKLDVSTDALQVWDFALKKNGGTLEDAAGFFEKLAAARDKAMGGGAEGATMAKHFHDLGVEVSDLKNKRIEDIAEQIGEVFKAGDPQKLIGSLRDVGGRGASSVIAALREGISESREEAERLGIIIDKSVVAELKEAGDQASIVGMRIRAGIAPVFSWLTEAVSGMQHAYSALFSGIFAGASILFTDLKFVATGKMSLVEAAKDVAHAVGEQFTQEAEEMNAEADALKKRASSSGVGGQDSEDSEAKADKVKRLDKETQDLKEKALLKTISLEKQITELYKKRAELQEKLNTQTSDHVGFAETNKEIAATELEIAEKSDELQKKKDDAAKQLADKTERANYANLQKQEKENAPSYSTLDELENSKPWVVASGKNWVRYGPSPFAQAASKIKYFEQDAKESAQAGNFDRRDYDLNQARGYRNFLEKSGVISPEHSMQAIDEKLGRLNQSLEDGTAKVNVLDN